jgi:hypothetical protein
VQKLLLALRRALVGRDPGSSRKPGTQDVASLSDTSRLEMKIKAAQQLHQSWHPGLGLMILGEHEATQ